MSLKINKATKQISIPRGDTGKIRGKFRTDGLIYEMSEGDKIEFLVKTDRDADEDLIFKETTENPFTIIILPENTENLEFGKYQWEMRFISANGEKHTLYKDRDFIVE